MSLGPPTPPPASPQPPAPGSPPAGPLAAGPAPTPRRWSLSLPATVRVLGIDPGTRVVGWGVVDSQGVQARAVAHGVLRLPAGRPIAERLARLAEGLRAVIAQWKPQEASIEEVFYGRDVRAAVRIGEGRGAALLVLAEAGIPVTGYANNVVKKAVGGAGRAGKDRVQAMVMRILAVEQAPEAHDASDALALALCHVQRRGFAGGAGGGPGLAPRVLEAIARAQRAARRK